MPPGSTIGDTLTVNSTAFNPENVVALLHHLPSEGFAATLVAAGASGKTVEEARERVTTALDERVKEVYAQLDGEASMA